MINFRFHLVSLIAIFLALAIGVVMGSTVIDRAIVDGLHSEINRIDAKADAEKTANDDLHNEVQRLQGVVQAEEPFATADRLRGVSVAVFAIDGVNADAVRSTVKLAQQSGASVQGIMWLQAKWQLASAADQPELAQILEGFKIDPGSDARVAAWNAIARRVAAGSEGSADPTTGAFFRALIDHGFLRYEAVGAQLGAPDGSLAPDTASRTLLVGGESERVHANDVMVPFTTALHRAGVATVVAETSNAAASTRDRGTVVGLVRDDGSLHNVVSTVDDLERSDGQLSAVLALHDVGQQVVGHYGYGAGATLSVPAWSAS
jgi:hypothetical protein